MPVRRVLRKLGSWRGAAVLTISAVVVALMGGAVSGSIEHLPTSPPPTTTTAPTTTTMSPAAGVQADVVRDMGLDIEAHRVGTDVATRQAEAVSPGAVAARHAAVAAAWAPDRVALVEARYDRSVPAGAGDPTQPSVTGGTFTVTRWVSVLVAGQSATVDVIGHNRFDEPGNRAAPGGVAQGPELLWHLTLTRAGQHWLIETRSATPPPAAPPPAAPSA